ncbi:cytochrome c family protein [Geobacter metallireducens RCH3]|uniref:Cytochrome c n=1 Tax=Geobacter metallireducens (strain ATCC 53774 / DSM 7210 / GS-15) TaxID=269799 RepID=Q39Y74_GEOMG|nr:cytochrome c3 family protein [Geobacter metallireducens]ABB30800.1 cytochrome c [Geobacter metallireducens GS-15]EHP88212.1 cytochrome c family protein [Geobacter metallireducens RCH3]
MKKRFLATAVMAAIMAWGAIVNAGPGKIKNTVHNMSSVAPSGFVGTRHWYSTDTDEVCVFCHTPHNAKPAQPLWNKVNPTQAFNMYTSSTTLTSVAKKVTAPSPESLLCLSCHDGRTAINVLHNSSAGIDAGGGDKKLMIGGVYDDPTAPAGVTGIPMNIDTFTIPNTYRANLGRTEADRYAGTNLMDDHPISFSYTAAYNEKVGSGSSAINPIATPLSKGLRFFGSNNRMECSTCHDPHVDYGMDFDGNPTYSGGNTALRPFLVRDNTGSAMCLACHNK